MTPPVNGSCRRSRLIDHAAQTASKDVARPSESSRLIPWAPDVFDGSLLTLFRLHIEGVLPGPDAVRSFHALLSCSMLPGATRCSSFAASLTSNAEWASRSQAGRPCRPTTVRRGWCTGCCSTVGTSGPGRFGRSARRPDAMPHARAVGYPDGQRRWLACRPHSAGQGWQHELPDMVAGGFLVARFVQRSSVQSSSTFPRTSGSVRRGLEAFSRSRPLSIESGMPTSGRSFSRWLVGHDLNGPDCGRILQVRVWADGRRRRPHSARAGSQTASP